MGFRIRVKDPQAIIRIGMLCLLLASVAPWILHPATDFWQNVLDGARGVLLGGAIGFNLWGARLAGRRSCGGTS
jgi:hypothetical protein